MYSSRNSTRDSARSSAGVLVQFWTTNHPSPTTSSAMTANKTANHVGDPLSPYAQRIALPARCAPYTAEEANPPDVRHRVSNEAGQSRTVPAEIRSDLDRVPWS